MNIATKGQVEHAVNEARIAAFGLIFASSLGTGLTVGFAYGSVTWGIVAGLVVAVTTIAVLAAVHHVRIVRIRVMKAMHWITGQ